MLSLKSQRQEWRRTLRRTFLRRWVMPVISRAMPLDTRPMLVIAPHQDDETLGCGGLIAMKRQAGVSVAVLFVTDGSRSHIDRPSAPPQEELVALRHREALAALAVLGVPEEHVHFLAFPDGELRDLLGMTRANLSATLARWLDEYKPEMIVVPHPRDGHPDHEAVFEAMVGVVKALHDSDAIPAIYAYPVWLFWTRNRLFDNLTWRDLRRAWRFPTQAVAGVKRQAMHHYQSQLEVLPPAFVEPILASDEYFFAID